MKTIMTATLAGTFLLLIAFLFLGGELPSSLASSSSQIYIHGTPVCVTQQGKGIVARVGECGMPSLPPGSGLPGRIPFRHGRPGMNLPPGHPPIDQPMIPDGTRRVLI